VTQFPHAEFGSNSSHQFGKRDLERLGDFLDIPKRNIAFATLDAADVRAVEITLSGKLLLRQFGAQP
jgi:hypothetical protein